MRCSHDMPMGWCVVAGCPHEEKPRGKNSSAPRTKTKKCRCGRRLPVGKKCDHESGLGYLNLSRKPMPGTNPSRSVWGKFRKASNGG